MLRSESPQRSEIGCGNCGEEFLNLYEFRVHRRRCDPDGMKDLIKMCEGFRSETCSIHAGDQSYLGEYRSVIVRPLCRCITVDHLLRNCKDGIQRTLEHCFEHGENIKAFSTVKVFMYKVDIPTGRVLEEDFTYSSTKVTAIQSRDEIHDFLDYVQRKLEAHIEKFTSKGSGWIVGGINEIAVKLVKYQLCGGGASKFVLPDKLANKKCVLNIETSNDQDCFKYAIVASLHHAEIDDNKSRRVKYDPFLAQYDFTNLKFPATDAEIIKFQKQNKSVAVNAFLYNHKEKLDGKRVTPLYHPPLNIEKDRNVANILLVNNHWLPVTNINRLLSSQTEDNRRDDSAYCHRCMRNCFTPAKLKEHLKGCYKTVGQKEIMPEASKAKMEFDDWSKMLSPPFAMYSDIEAILEKSDDDSKILQTHVPCAVGSYLVAHKSFACPAQKVVFHQGEDCIEQYCKFLEDKAREIYAYNKIRCNKPQQRNNPEHVRKFERTTSCDYCKVPFCEQTPKVWHHDHISGEFLATLCQRCNTRIRQPMATLPVLFHNLRNYDMHALCISGFSKMQNWELKPIAQTKEKYLTLTAQMIIDHDESNRPIFFTLRFVDTFQFMSASLERLVKTIDQADMQHVRQCQYFSTLPNDVIYGKGVFPYSYLDSADKLDEPSLPPKAAFFNRLSNSLQISDHDYDRAQRAWTGFHCTTLGDYMLHYLELDCLLLADVFENFRSKICSFYSLDAANFITLPQLTFSAAFRSCKVDLLTDVFMYEFFEQGIRGGMTFVNKHHLAADNTTEISYWDENNLYGGALRQPLPCGDFKWLEPQEFEMINWHTIDTEGDIGYTLKVNLEYPQEIHDKTQDIPLGPETACVTREMFTPYMEQQWRGMTELRNRGDKFVPCKKLLMTCRDKEAYVVHFKLLKFYLKMGLKIRKIHSVVQYKQKPIFRNCIDRNSELRQNAVSAFITDLFKLLNNALYGKTMENVRGRKDYRLPNSVKKFRKLASKPQFLSCHRFNDDLVLTELLKLEVVLNRPIFIGQAVLDLSKLTMYQLRYEQLPKYEVEFQGRICVLGGDTDSLICCINNIGLQDLHRSMLRDGLLHTSNYPDLHPLRTDKYKAVLGCIKDEVEGDRIVEAVLLKPKCYSSLTENSKTS